MLEDFLALLNGQRASDVVWTADLSYWINGRKQDGTADSQWDSEEGYLQLHRDLGVMPYYYYEKFWTAAPVYDACVSASSLNENGRFVRTLSTPIGELREESEFLPASCCHGIVKHMVEDERDLDVMLYALEHRHLNPCNLEDYQARRELWTRYDGLPALGLPRSPLPAFAYEWAGLTNTIMLLMDCEDKVLNTLALLEEQETPVLDAICELAPPLVHFPDNLSSDNFTSYYDVHMKQRHRSRLAKLHSVGVKAAVHLDGSVRGLLPKLIDSGFDAIEALTPHPAGDMTVAAMADLAQDHATVLWGGVPGAMFAAPFSWKQMEAHVEHTLATWGNRPFVLGVADQVPPDGDADFCRNIRAVLNRGGP